MFNKLSLKSKLLFLCGTLLFFTLLVGGVSYWGLNLVDASYHKVANSSLPKIKSIDKMYLSYQQIRINLRTLGMPGLSKDQQEEAIRKTISSIESYEAEDSHYEKMAFLSGEKILYDKLEKNWTDFKAIGTKVLGLQKSGLPEDKEKILAIFLKDCPEAAALYDESIKSLVKFHEENAKLWVETAMADSATAKKLQSIIIAVGLFGGLSIGYFFAITISRLLNDISTNLSSGSDLISNITTKISSVSTSLSTNITQQASALQQTTSAVEQTSASVISNADNAKKSAEVSKLSKESVHFGKEAVDEVIQSINEISTSTIEIKNQIDKSNEEISDIVKIISEINLKTKVINEIVFQTKLLSFNASVEAARAGEHGKGFAVVAEEVGNLARMSGNSAKEISDLLESSTLKVQSTVENSKFKIEKLMQLSNQKIELGNITAQKCKTALDEIIDNVGNVDALISEITSASHEQSLSIREITKAMGEIDTASYQNSASSKEASVAADSLGAQVEDFRTLVTKLNVIVTGEKAA